MIKEAIDYIADLVRNGDEANVITVPNVHRKSFMILRGNAEPFEHDPPIRKHAVSDMDSAIAFAKRYAATCAVWHSEDKVCVLVDDQWREDAITFTLDKSSAWTAAMALGKPQTQGDLLDAFRTDLKDVVGESHPELISLFTNVKFKRRDDSGAVIDHGRESLGRELERTVTGTDKLPEEITLMLRPYVAIESESAVRLALKVDYQNEKFRFRPVGDDVQAAIDAAQDVIRERFSGVTEKVYYGTP